VNQQRSKIILVGGKTGGPIIPLLAIAKKLAEYQPLIYGVKGGFEDNIANENRIPFYSFPETKIRLLTFKSSSIQEFVFHVYDLFRSLILLSFAIVKAGILLIRHKPKAIFSSGGFLAVPVIYANQILSIVGLSNSKVIIHQQDPQPGLTNRVTARYADLLTCVFASSKKYSRFKNALIIPNPFDKEIFEADSIEQIKTKMRQTHPQLLRFIELSTNHSGPNISLPILLIFGGGSGSEFINKWVVSNLDSLTRQFRVLHLTGTFRATTNITDNSEYFAQEFLLDEMKVALIYADLVLSRCGVGSITELQNLDKPGFLVPLPDSHQEENAREVADSFVILHQKDSARWLDTINESYPTWFQTSAKKTFTDQQGQDMNLTQYYQTIKTLID
jgi:UDP-N-acetylglucosamine--N-acetylmuramyl-(pentapeptide) pyrophosphoryl-undecaprenol N-acetylglucosamine transferase